jgi:hypothetical protein
MGYSKRQGIGVARVIEGNTTRLARVGKSTSANQRSDIPDLRILQLSASQAFDIPAIRLCHRDHDIVAEGIERSPFLVFVPQLLAPKVLEPRWCQLGISHRVLDVLVSEIRL